MSVKLYVCLIFNKFVAFESGANDADNFERDLKTGTTTLASVNNAGTTSRNDYSDSPCTASRLNTVCRSIRHFKLPPI